MTRKGRPKGAKNIQEPDKKVQINVRVSEESAEYLESMKRRGYVKAKVVDRAILADKDKFGGER